MKNKNIVVWFSCGAASAVAAKKTIEFYRNDNNVIIVNSPVINEHEDNNRFLKDCEIWFGQKIEKAINSKYPKCDITEVFDDRKYMSGVRGAPCTMILKKGARYEYEKNHKIDYHVLGFTLEEQKRQDRFSKFERENTIPVLIDLGITKRDCFDIIRKAKIELPFIYSLGYSNANCIGCVKSQSPTYWNLVRKTFPKIYKERAEQSRKIGVKLVKVKGKRIYLDELKVTDLGGKIKNWDCGLFCDSE